MSTADKADSMSVETNKFLDLGTRILSAIAMIAISVAAFWLGGYWAIGFIGLGALVMLWEFHKMLRQETVRGKIDLAIMVVSASLSAVATFMFGWIWGALALIIGAAALFKSDDENWFWLSSGLLYIGASMTAMLIIFLSPEHGLFDVFWVVSIVALTDIVGTSLDALLVALNYGQQSAQRKHGPAQSVGGVLPLLPVFYLVGLVQNLLLGL